MKVSKKQAVENRELLLTGAARLFRENGVAGAAVDALGHAAGMTHRSVYSQFGSKEELLAEALKRGFERTGTMAARVNDVLESFLFISHGVIATTDALSKQIHSTILR